jgi:hypothetical protein
VTRQLTHRRVTFHVYRGHIQLGTRDPSTAGQAATWVSAEDLPNLGLSRASEAVLQLIGWPAAPSAPRQP